MSHRFHPTKNDQIDAILFDDCEDCTIKTKRLGAMLDPDRWSELWRRMLVTEMPLTYQRKYPDTTPGYRSLTEQKLGSQMYGMYLIFERQNDVYHCLGTGQMK